MNTAIRFLDVVIWPVVALCALVVLVSPWGRAFVAAVVGRVRRISAFGVELELSPEAAPRIKDDFESGFRELRSKTQSEFDRQTSLLRLLELRRKVVEDAVVPNLREPATPYRCTIHVPDILFEEVLYQLLDYYPGRRGTAGRTFSMRFGIVGRAWRSGDSQFEPSVSIDPRRLIREWGMLIDEAAGAGQGRQSFVAVVLKQRDFPVGIFYVDSQARDAFDEGIIVGIESSASQVGLAEALGELDSRMRNRGPSLSIFDL